MRAVRASYSGGRGGWWPIGGIWQEKKLYEDWLADEKRRNIVLPCLHVRYSNGQLCTFRRKSPPQGGEG